MIKDIDPERMSRLIGSMREAIANLSELGGLSETEFLEDKHKQSSAKYNFIVANRRAQTQTVSSCWSVLSVVEMLCVSLKQLTLQA